MTDQKPKRRGRTFKTVAPTAPNADERPPAIETPRRPEIETSISRKPAAYEGKTAFTWRLTTDQALRLDALLLKLRRDLQYPKLDKATMLDALTREASENTAIYGALLARLQGVQTS